jgi:hypothetical protein
MGKPLQVMIGKPLLTTKETAAAVEPASRLTAPAMLPAQTRHLAQVLVTGCLPRFYFLGKCE